MPAGKTLTAEDLRIGREKRLSVMLVVLLASLYLTNFSYVLSSFVDINYSLISRCIKFLPVLAVLAVLPDLWYTQYSKGFVALVVGLLLLYGWSSVLVFNSHYTEYIKYFIMVCLPCMIVTYAIGDYHYFLSKLKYVSIAFSLLALLLLVLYQSRTDTDTDTDYFMAYSYSSAMMAIALFSDVPVKRGWKPLVLAGEIIYLASIVLLGARGPLLTISLFLISKNISTPKRSLPVKLLVLLVFGVLLLTYDRIFSVLNDLALSVGIKSRTLASLSSKDISLSGRENFYSFYLGEILSNPLKFRGIASDWDQMGYPHQIFLELSYQFGTIGILASILIVGAVLYLLLFRHYEDPFAQTCDVFFLAIGLYTLLLSNSLWKSLQFWVWLGYLFQPQKGTVKNAPSRNQLLQLWQHRQYYAPDRGNGGTRRC